MHFLVFGIIFLNVWCIKAAPANPKSKQFMRISESKDCQREVNKFCKDVSKKDDLLLLNCLQDNEMVMRELSGKCQHFLWEYKRYLTTSNLLDELTKTHCNDDLAAIEECKNADKGHRVTCLFDFKKEIKNEKCVTFLNEIGIAIFSDYHLIYKFVSKCKPDIRRLKCGRLYKNKNGIKEEKIEEGLDDVNEPNDMVDYMTSQAKTLDCLVSHLGRNGTETDSKQDLSSDCHHEIIRLAELQADDYHLNRPLYLACREDRENLCAHVQAGEGRVYDCLYKNKFNEQMSKACREQLTKKQQIEAEDVESNFLYFKHCKDDLKKYNCMSNQKDEFTSMSKSILCLERAEYDAEQKSANVDDNVSILNPHCKAEINKKRLDMLRDYQLTPEVVDSCKEDAYNLCAKEVKVGNPGTVLHCLMKKSEPDEKNKNNEVSKKCKVALTNLLKLANPSEDILHLDPVIANACGSYASSKCDVTAKYENIFECLVSHIDDPEMPQLCQENLNSIMYFIKLDINIDNNFKLVCAKDAKKYCNVDKASGSSLEIAKLYQCMYDLYRTDRVNYDLASKRGELEKFKFKLNSDCAREMFNLIRVQASKVELNPLVYEPCVIDLGNYCSGSDVNKFKCLEENIKNLKPMCKRAVLKEVQMKESDYKLQVFLSKVCTPVVKKLCDNVPDQDVIQCLEEHKTSPEMTEGCAVALNHFQIISLEEYDIDHKFTAFCGDEITKLCSRTIGVGKDVNKEGKPIIKLQTVLSCLSEAVLKSYIKNTSFPLGKKCSTQFSYEMLKRSDSVKLDPQVAETCKTDLKTFCDDQRESQQVGCLREHQDELTKECHLLLFKREKIEAHNAHYDGRLMRVCHQMIQEHCHEEPGHRLFQCLHRKMHESDFDPDCQKLLFSRLKRRMNDVRLNPELISDCGEEIQKYCHPNKLDSLDENDGKELEGKIITCLKGQFMNNTLGQQCRGRMVKIIFEANAYLDLDPVLKRKCKEDLHLCQVEREKNPENNLGSVQTCLKHQLLKQGLKSDKCKKEVIRLLRESEADIHMDIQLFHACEEAILKFCGAEDFGSGRKVTCLLNSLSSKEASSISPRCHTMLVDRQKMWSFVNDVNSMAQIYDTVRRSSSSTYFISMFILGIALILMVGVCCGRVTKRIPVDMKNK